jgi:preprotein translocase subunit SecA
VTLATITFQNYFRQYDKLAGMTGTAMTEAEEFHKIYKLEVVAIPTHREMIRDDDADLVYRNEKAKFDAVIGEIVEMRELGRPVLVGTVSVEKSEVLSEMLKRQGIEHHTLNAKFHEREALVVAQAGRTGAVTISTNMAGRGTDILLGGNPAGIASDILHKRDLNPAEVDKETYDAAFAEAKAICDTDHGKVVAAGGLHIIGTERHESRRIDNQLRGRAGRQGDPGSSRFYLSLDDDLMKRFASERVAGLMERLGLEDDMAIESRIVSKTIESAQSRVEGYNFDMRKRVVEFDDVINRQRETIYAERDKVLRNEDLTDSVRDFVDEEIDGLVDEFLMGDNVDDWNMGGLAEALAAMGLDDKRLTEDALWEAGDRESIGAHIFEVADEALADREERYGEEGWSLAERVVLLRTIDSLWVEHLTELDDMRRGIGLRGYAQQDPLNEFRKEAFRLYGELRGFIRHGVASAIFRVTVNVTPTDGDGHTHGDGPRPLAGGPYRAPRPLPTPAAGSGAGDGGGTPAGVAAAGAAAGAGAAATNPAGTKLGRNDPCWCGSGQKYKRCHGR